MQIEVETQQSSQTRNCLKKHSVILFWVSLAVLFLATSTLTLITLKYESSYTNAIFWCSFLIKTIFLAFVQYILGYAVEHYQWYVGYTRKVIHIGYFLLPFTLDLFLPLKANINWIWSIWNFILICWMLMGITKPVRNKFPIVETMYKAIDRPEDKKLTQIYTIIQVPISVIVIACGSILLKYLEVEVWTLIPIISVTFGDGLAEPVAVFWKQYNICGGLYEYKTKGLFSDKVFNRSIQGSLTVFIFTLLGVVLVYSDLKRFSRIYLMSFLPLSMMVLEAVAPHSLDNPILLLWGYLNLLGAYYGDYYLD